MALTMPADIFVAGRKKINACMGIFLNILAIFTGLLRNCCDRIARNRKENRGDRKRESRTGGESKQALDKLVSI